MPLEERPPHIWECLQYLKWREGVGDVPDQIEKNVRIMRHIAQDVAKHIAKRLEAQGAYKDQTDRRWPRYHQDSQDPLYLTGCYPPLNICLPNSDQAWDAGSLNEKLDNLREFTDWFHTPAGMHGFSDDHRAEARKNLEIFEAEVKGGAAGPGQYTPEERHQLILATSSVKNLMPKAYGKFSDETEDVEVRRKALRQLIEALDERYEVPAALDRMNPIDRDRSLFGDFFMLDRARDEVDLRAFAEQLEAVCPRPPSEDGSPSVSMADTFKLHGACVLARDKFTEAWHTFFNASKSDEERRDAFALIFGYVDQQMSRTKGFFSSRPAEGRQALTFLAMISFPGVPKSSHEEETRLISKIIPLPEDDISSAVPGPLGL